MKKKYVIAVPSSTDYSPLFYKDNVGFTSEIPTIAMSMKKAKVFCKNSPLATWIIEYGTWTVFDSFKQYFASFDKFIEECKDCKFEVIETRPSIYTPSEIESAIPEEEFECGYVIRHEFGSFICILNDVEGGIFAISNLPKSAIIFRTKKEAEFQAKVLQLKSNEKFSVVKVDLNTFF
jgi:hypothetical protein